MISVCDPVDERALQPSVVHPPNAAGCGQLILDEAGFRQIGRHPLAQGDDEVKDDEYHACNNRHAVLDEAPPHQLQVGRHEQLFVLCNGLLQDRRSLGNVRRAVDPGDLLLGHGTWCGDGVGREPVVVGLLFESNARVDDGQQHVGNERADDGQGTQHEQEGAGQVHVLGG